MLLRLPQSLLTLLALGFAVTPALASDDKVGFGGTLSSLDGGLGGTVTVQDPKTLSIKNYRLEDASAPALYWWGSTSDNLKSGFRISEKQVKGTSKGGDLEIPLDAGKTAADFSTVGLWCERFGVNYGQATLKASGGAAASGATGTAASAAAGTPSASSGRRTELPVAPARYWRVSRPPRPLWPSWCCRDLRGCASCEIVKELSLAIR